MHSSGSLHAACTSACLQDTEHSSNSTCWCAVAITVRAAGRNAFKPLQELLPGLASGMDYSTAVKDVVWNRQGSAHHTASSANRAFTSTTSLGSSFSRGDLGTLPSMESYSIPLPETPTASVNTPTSSHGGDSKQQAFSLKSCTVPQLVSHLQQLPEDDTAGLTAAAKEVRDRARNDLAARELLVWENVVPALVRLLQMPLLSEGQPQIAAAWALYYCMGRSKAAPQGCPEAAAAMDAAGAVKHATAVLRAVRKQASSSGTFSEPLPECSRLERSASTASSACASASTSPTQSGTKPEQQEADEESTKVPARVQEAAVAVLAGVCCWRLALQPNSIELFACFPHSSGCQPPCCALLGRNALGGTSLVGNQKPTVLRPCSPPCRPGIHTRWQAGHLGRGWRHPQHCPPAGQPLPARLICGSQHRAEPV